MGNVTILGLLGGVGSGKSTVARALADLGAIVLDADRIAHDVLAEPAVVRAIHETFGDAALGRDDTVDRTRLAGIVFEDPERLAALNAIVHPQVGSRIRARIEAIRNEASDPRVVVLDVPLLLESQLNTLCDKRLFVDTPLDVRVARVRESRGWSEDELLRREKNQKPLAEKLEAADYKVRNTGPADPILARLRAIYGELIHSAPACGSSPGATPRPKRSTDPHP